MFYLFRDSASYFPQLYDFSHLHVLEGAEFTHAHWAEFTRVLDTEVEWNLVTDIGSEAPIGPDPGSASQEINGNAPQASPEPTTLEPLLRDAVGKPQSTAPPSPTGGRIQLDKVLVHLDSLDIGWLESLMKLRGC